MYSFYTLDWLRFSVDRDYDLEEIHPLFARKVGTEKLIPFRGYNAARKLVVGRADWHTERPEQRKSVTLTGEDLKDVTEWLAHSTLIKRLLEIPHIHFSRVDFAADLLESEVRAADVKELILQGHAKTQKRKVGSTEITVLGSEAGGMTVYLGARTSEGFIRIYDKDKQTGKTQPHLRLELEAKGRLANAMVRAMVGQGNIMGTGCAFLQRQVDIDSPAINELMAGALDIDTTLGRKTTDHDRWLIEIALKAVIEAIRAGNQTVITKLNDELAHQ